MLPESHSRFAGCHWRRTTTAILALSAAICIGDLRAQTLIYQEGFNDDGEKASPPRYTVDGREVFEVQRIVDELNNADQKGPIYWAHNFDVSFVGIPEIPARRMIFAWGGVNDTSVSSQAFQELFVSSVKWMIDNKPNATVVVAPDITAIGGLADVLTAAGFTVNDDDPTVQDDQVQGDLLIHAVGPNASRFARSPKPVIVMNAPDYDDMLVGSIGATSTFEPGTGEIAAVGHPAAGGKTGKFEVGTGPLSFHLVGRFLPQNATTLATVVRRVPPAVTRLTDVDDLIAGTKEGAKTTAQVTALDFADGSPGSWFYDNPLPGGEAGNWGLHATGKLNVTAAGTYSVAIGSDDGARLQIDLDRNGFTPADTIIEDFGPHAYLIQYANVTFPSTGVYDFQVISYNSGGGGSVEFSIANTAGANITTALDSGDWDLVGADDAISPVKAQGLINVTSFTATGATTEVKEPLIVLLNGPNDTPRGFFYGGGPFEGFEGAGFFAGSGLNKWPFPDGKSYRSVQLRPVDVSGKENVKLTIALAAAQIDNEDSDFLDILAYPNGVDSRPVTLAHFRGVQNGVQPWLADQREKFVRRLTRQFADFQYDVPTNSTQLVIEIRAFTSWWNEIVAFDNVRITSGATPPVNGEPTLAVRLDGGNVVIEFNGTLESAASVTGPWAAVANASSPHTIQKANVSGTLFYRARRP